MKLSLRFITPLILTLGLLAYAVVPVVDGLTLEWFKRDLFLRAELISKSIALSIKEIGEDESRIPNLLENFAEDERVLAIGLCETRSHRLIKTSRFPETLNCTDAPEHSLLTLPDGPIHYYAKELPEGRKIILLHDMSFVQRRSSSTKNLILIFFLILAVVVSAITVLIAQLSFRGWMSNIRTLIRGKNFFGLMKGGHRNELRPIAKDLRILVHELERERKIRDESTLSWTPRMLKELLQKELSGDEVLVLSNREPYIHNKVDGRIKVQIPASGLVTALEPIMRACSGTWIAHGSGSADHEVVDEHDRVDVPPDNPSYKIRRVWLTKEEEQGYYFGFSNEGMWPLCHIAHTRPTFRTTDWFAYRSVNQKFADAVVAEAKTDNPVILIQDYHFALAPRMIRKKLPRATIITFWHIPWPNAESFGICPWREEVLEGLLGSSILGFHTQFHCNNFLDSADRYLECRIDRDVPQVYFQKRACAVKAYPISIEWPPQKLEHIPSIFECRDHVRAMNNISSEIKIGIGVDRFDYTKGILERFMAIERLFELYPKYIGKFSFVQIAAPTRSSIVQYQYFQNDVMKLCERINAKYSSGNYKPILLLAEHHEPEQVFRYFRAADVCFVSSLHDGMNLVAKEYVSSRNDEEGVLILSQFTGASKELTEALIVNPYNIDHCAHSLALALEMSVTEQNERMRNMRALIREHNVFRWAGRMLIDAARLRQRNRIERRYGSNG